MSGVVADTSVWIDFLAGRPVPFLEDALAHAAVILPPIVVAELVSGARRPADRRAIQELVREMPIHETPVEHWVRVGELRRTARDRGLSVSTPDAHVAQCAIERDAVLLSRDAIFARIASVSSLRVRD
ncbi:MAG: PIN domain-containing protein [Candidatus Rokubacteria bacterium]|nr:PIN domain-containing protein [Candidatus Rokubacteria bacterium]